jgi:hypothetical protein
LLREQPAASVQIKRDARDQADISEYRLHKARKKLHCKIINQPTHDKPHQTAWCLPDWKLPWRFHKAAQKVQTFKQLQVEALGRQMIGMVIIWRRNTVWPAIVWIIWLFERLPARTNPSGVCSDDKADKVRRLQPNGSVNP